MAGVLLVGLALGCGESRTGLIAQAAIDAGQDATAGPGPDASDASSGTVDAVARDATPPNGKLRMFVTSTELKGQFGSSATSALAAADARCTSLAQAAGLKGEFTAYLSTSTVPAVSRIRSTGPWYAVGDETTPLFDGRSSLDVVSWSDAPRVRDELGNLARDSRAKAFSIWTGTRRDGTPGRSCGDWTQSTGFGVVGTVCDECKTNEWRNDQDIGAAGWTAYACDGESRLYCFEDAKL